MTEPPTLPRRGALLDNDTIDLPIVGYYRRQRVHRFRTARAAPKRIQNILQAVVDIVDNC